jgi:long-chain fatty acid transport protein
MRKFLTFVAATFISGILLAGGIVTNTNQSASWVRLPSRNASVGIDAVYFNPAGLMKLKNGFHFSISNQSITQTKKVENFYNRPNHIYGLNQSLFEGTVSAPVFPSVYAVYKMDRLAFSFGFNPIGGGGGAVFKKGLPSFELSPADLVPALQSTNGADAYRLNAYFEGSSIFFGFQGGVSFKINDVISVAAGLRYVTAKNTYKGHLTDIELELPSGWTRADAIMNGISAQLTSITTIPASLAPALPALGTLNLATAAGFSTSIAAAKPSIEAALASMGIPAASIAAMSLNAISATVTAASPSLLASAAKYGATATLLGDQSADAAQTGAGITPVFSVNISPSENLNIGIKYEMITRLELVNKTKQDLTTGFTAAGAPITMFPDGDLTASDMPAMLSVGVDYKLTPELKLSLGGNYFFDKNADYGHKMDLDNNPATPSTFVKNSTIIASNGFSLQGGLEYNITDKFLVSGGYIYANQGVNANYQSDLNYFLVSQSFGIGGAYSVKDNIQIYLGFGYTMYQKDEKNITHVFAGTPATIYRPLETYAKNTMMVGIGVDFSF